METLAQQLQDALGPTVAVYLGAEYMERQPELPHVVVVPAGAEIRPPSGLNPGALADASLEVRLIARAVRFDEAQLLAEACYTVLRATSPSASLKLRSEAWGDYTVRVADLSVTLPASIPAGAITRVQVLTFAQHLKFTQQEAPDGQDISGQPTGSTSFLEHADPDLHR